MCPVNFKNHLNAYSIIVITVKYLIFTKSKTIADEWANDYVLE